MHCPLNRKQNSSGSTVKPFCLPCLLSMTSTRALHTIYQLQNFHVDFGLNAINFSPIIQIFYKICKIVYNETLNFVHFIFLA